MKKCPGSIGGHKHGHVYYRRRGIRICHYCNQPVVQTKRKEVING